MVCKRVNEVLQYTKWNNFKIVIDKSKISCEQSGNVIENHFADVSKMIELAKGAKRKIQDYKLSRYACYLIVQNADARKKEVALAQTYFAIQTRKYELKSKYADARYKGLYNGETAIDIAKRKGVSETENLSNFMSEEERTINEFCISLAEQKIQNENIKEENNICEVYYEVGKIIRENIIKLGNTPPEKLPNPSNTLEKLEEDKLKNIKGGCFI